MSVTMLFMGAIASALLIAWSANTLVERYFPQSFKNDSFILIFGALSVIVASVAKSVS